MTLLNVVERNLGWWRQLRSLAFLAILTVALLQDEPRPGLTGRDLAVLAGMVAGGLAWVAMTFQFPAPRFQQYNIYLCMLAGLWLTAVRSGGYGGGYLLAATTMATATLSPRRAGVFTGIGALALTVTLAVTGAKLQEIVIWAGAMLLLLLLGSIRRERRVREEQDRLLADEKAHGAALAERARLAREIHDVLAHSLSALSVQLETAAALLERDRAADAAVIVDKAGRLARDGLTETRRAVSALRGDPVPLPELVRELAAGFPATFAMEGAPRDLSPETGLALFRSAQEALTNVHKHAPGSAVDVRLAYLPREVRLTVRNHGPAGPPATGLSSGYGLQGLRERAELAGGTVDAGPCEDGWLVDVKMPA